MKNVVFNNEITLYWDKTPELTGAIYTAYIDGKEHGTTTKTHYTFDGLNADTAYDVEIKLNGKEFHREIITTKKAKKRVDVTKEPYFAANDGKTTVTKILQKALDELKPDEMIYFPAGTYLIGALDLHDGTEMFIDEGATIQGSSEIEEYCPKIPSRFEGLAWNCYRPLIGAGKVDTTGKINAHGIILRGKGSIIGGGRAFGDKIIEHEREILKDYIASIDPEKLKEYENGNTIPGRARPRLIMFSNTEDIIIEGLTIGFGPSWNIHLLYCKNVVTYNCKLSSWGTWNGDGWDPESSENCTIFATSFRMGDNAIAIKSGKNPEGDVIAIPSRNIKIFDVNGGLHTALGSEMSGGIENVYIWDCDLEGLTVKTTRKRGGYIRNLFVLDCTLPSIDCRTRLNYNNDGDSAKEIAVIENLHYENLTLSGVSKYREEKRTYPVMVFDGFEEKEHRIKNVTLKNIKILPREDGKPQTVEVFGVDNLKMENIEYL